MRHLFTESWVYCARFYRPLVAACLGGGAAGCDFTIPIAPVGTPPTIEMTIEADGGEQAALLESDSCQLTFFEYERPVLVIASGKDSDEGVKNVRLEGEVRFSCGIGDCIDGLSQPILEEFSDDASPGEQGRTRRTVLRLILFNDLDEMCVAESLCGFLDKANVNLFVSAQVENFHGGTAATPPLHCFLEYAGPPPPLSPD